jgi:hypothetical protein
LTVGADYLHYKESKHDNVKKSPWLASNPLSSQNTVTFHTEPYSLIRPIDVSKDVQSTWC